MRLPFFYATLWLLALLAVTAAVELKGRRSPRGLQAPPPKAPPVKKIPEQALEYPLLVAPAKVPKASKEVVFKQDKQELGTSNVIAPSAVPLLATTTMLYLPTASPTAQALEMSARSNQIDWILILYVEPQISRQALNEAVTEYLGPSSARLTLMDSNDNNDILFTVHSEDGKALDHQLAILDRPALESFLRNALRQHDLQVITAELDNRVSSVVVEEPKRVVFIMFIVSLFAIGILLGVFLYVVPYLQLRRDYEQEWTFSEEREAAVWHGTSA